MRLLVAAVYAIAAAGIWQLGFVGLIQPPTAPSKFKVAMGAAQGETGVTQTSAPGTVRKRVRKQPKLKATRVPKVKVRKLGKSREGASENSVWDFIREKDKQAMEEGAFMDTFLGQLVTTITLGISVLLILWEIYLNTLYPRVYPTYNPLNPQIMVDESMQEDQ
ncbi:unnamed protein product [Symbiodinium sp. CCMP2592]|nr:unnamed protein product [Symbiodinium sp. CCMP2592]